MTCKITWRGCSRTSRTRPTSPRSHPETEDSGSDATYSSHTSQFASATDCIAMHLPRASGSPRGYDGFGNERARRRGKSVGHVTPLVARSRPAGFTTWPLSCSQSPEILSQFMMSSLESLDRICSNFHAMPHRRCCHVLHVAVVRGQPGLRWRFRLVGWGQLPNHKLEAQSEGEFDNELELAPPRSSMRLETAQGRAS